MITDKLKYTVTTGREGTNAQALEKRKFNIAAFSDLDRTGLQFGLRERCLLLKTTEQGEKIYIQYPGKETLSTSEDKVRPWDFRPKVTYNNGNDRLKDLSFPDIWDDLSTIHTNDNELLSILASIFFRVAYMVDYEKVSGSFAFEDIDVESGNIVNSGTLDLEYYALVLDAEIYDYINEHLGKIRDVSFEAYLLYNDMLVQNEDCKYFYRDEYIKNLQWKGKTGRNSTMLSHLSVIQFIRGEVKFSEIMSRFQRGFGVGPIPTKDIPELTNHIIEKE